MSARLDPVIERYRFAHHNVAMMFAAGMTIELIAKRTGFTRRRLVILLDDPTFNELIEHYRLGHLEHLKGAIPDAMEHMATAHLMSLRQIVERLEEADEEGAEPIPLPSLIKIHGEMADRTGYSKHTVKTVFNVSFAEQLDRAIERSGKGPELKLIEGGVLSTVVETVKPAPVERSVEVPRPRAYRRV